MLHQVSWQQYGLFIALLTALYYAVVYMLFVKKQPLPAGSPSINQEYDQQLSLFSGEPDQDTSLEPLVYACMDELNAFFDHQQKYKAVKADVLRAVTAILSKYPSLKTSGYQASLSQVIALQCENRCSIPLSAAEQKEVWTMR